MRVIVAPVNDIVQRENLKNSGFVWMNLTIREDYMYHTSFNEAFFFWVLEGDILTFKWDLGLGIGNCDSCRQNCILYRYSLSSL